MVFGVDRLSVHNWKLHPYIRAVHQENLVEHPFSECRQSSNRQLICLLDIPYRYKAVISQSSSSPYATISILAIASSSTSCTATVNSPTTQLPRTNSKTTPQSSPTTDSQVKASSHTPMRTPAQKPQKIKPSPVLPSSIFTSAQTTQ